MKKVLLVITVALLVTGLNAQKEKGSWSKVTETTVDFKNTKAVINVANVNAYKSLQIKTTDAPVHVDNLVVVYADGEPENIPIRFDFKAGAESRAINLQGVKRNIKEIDIQYRTVPNWKGDKATVEIWGMK